MMRGAAPTLPFGAAPPQFPALMSHDILVCNQSYAFGITEIAGRCPTPPPAPSPDSKPPHTHAQQPVTLCQGWQNGANIHTHTTKPHPHSSWNAFFCMFPVCAHCCIAATGAYKQAVSVRC